MEHGIPGSRQPETTNVYKRYWESRHTAKHTSCAHCPLPMAHRRRKLNTTELLDLRTRGISDAGVLTSTNLKILRARVLQDNTNFIKVWTKTSKSTILYECGKIYFENYQSCYSCANTDPQLLYNLPNRSKVEKIEDALLCRSPLEKTLPTPSDHIPCLLALTANNWLYRLSAETGKELQKVYLSPRHKFRYLGWDVPQETFYVKSIQNKGTPSARMRGMDQNTLMYLAIFHVFPLQVVAVLEINKMVFGHSVTDVVMSQGVLAVSHSTKSVKFYSFEHIMNKYMTSKLALGDQHSSNNTVGEVPFGIPVNINFKDCPPVLFEVSCSDNSVQIGGYPWHYIYTPPKKKHKGTHHICSLGDRTLATNGVQTMHCCCLESDWIYFHPDDSGRIIHVGPSTINVLKMISELNSGLPSKIVEDFSITAHRDNNAASQITVTSSGRTVKRILHQLDDDPEKETFRMVEFEDELDLLAVLVTDNEEGEGSAHVRLYDNKSGALLKRVPLLESWDETYRHEFFFDKDTIVHIEQKNNTFSCHVYKLQTNMEKL